MKPGKQTTWIKRGLHRSVSIELSREGEPRLVKHFRGHTWLKRLGDRARARREFELLKRLHELGLRVPEALELKQNRGAWEVHCEWIEGARDLGQLLREPGMARQSAREVAGKLGGLVGKAHAIGLDHGDLHAGNLMIDNAGCAWMVDFTAGVLRKELSPAILERDLVALAADTREFVSLGTRRRFFVAWRRAIGRGAHSALAAKIESLAAERRCASLIEHSDRWLRASGLCELNGESLLSKSLFEARPELRQQLAWLEERGKTKSAQLLEQQGQEFWVDGLSPSAHASWVELGRARQHQLPALEPLALFKGGSCAYFVPDQARPLDAIGPLDLELGRLHGVLYDRSLHLANNNHLWRNTSGRLILGPGCRLLPGRKLPDRSRASLPDEYIASFLTQWRGTRTARLALDIELNNG
ncbi:MAG: tRNA A-37 threonylcarbamoyl transferase component Bud32 [Planctomycetota bacterium]|jgi:tRNA A-37 threonylcarbamoyl transferase component Bud32